jgi:hypothetical protein
MTLISLEEIWERLGIEEKDRPRPITCMRYGQQYDKWGNVIFEDGHRFPGPLFKEDNVQKVLKKAGLIGVFYPEDHFDWIHKKGIR